MALIDLATLMGYGNGKASTLPFTPAPNANIPPAAGTGGGTDENGDWGSLKTFGTASQGLSALGSLLQAYNGYKQLQLGQDAFDFQKSAYNQDATNQATLVNSELEDRQKARISSTGNNNANGVYESLGTYLPKNRVAAKQL